MEWIRTEKERTKLKYLGLTYSNKSTTQYQMEYRYVICKRIWDIGTPGFNPGFGNWK